MSEAPIILWFRRDLRLDDHPALHAAVQSGAPVIPTFIWSPEEAGDWSPGSASRWWLHQSLSSLRDDLERSDSFLILRIGNALDELRNLADETGAGSVYWNRCYEPALVERDKSLKAQLRKDGLEARSFQGNLLYEPWKVSTQEDNPYRVFTPFWKRCRQQCEPAEPFPAPSTIPRIESRPDSCELERFGLLPNVDWAGGFRDEWHPGEAGAREKCDEFLEQAIETYQGERDRPDRRGTSRLSPHLHHGEISVRRIWYDIEQRCETDRRTSEGKSLETFRSELGWREFAHHVLFHFPETADHPLREQFEEFPWIDDRVILRRWQRGKTGYPIVDAGMRELWESGWMHNRVRMIVGSFLTKDLLISWKEGARWFWDTLVDADLANNTLGWQWVSGCGADAAPYFRVFNPVTQGKKFDPEGDYVRRWVPELKELPKKWIHDPWNAPEDVLADADVSLRESYPVPIVDHGEARKAALAALEKTK